jgi:hypothetical protein
MSTIRVKDIGFCAHFSRQGDWAFEFALSVARLLNSQLSIFYFPWVDRPVSDWPGGRLRDNELVNLDRQVREYYDDKLGDFLDVGFRVCEDLVDKELRRCLFHRDYQVMVLGYLAYQAPFGDCSIESFAYRFNGPLVLVGPRRPDQFYLNPPATLVRWQLGLSDDAWEPLTAPPEIGAVK